MPDIEPLRKVLESLWMGRFSEADAFAFAEVADELVDALKPFCKQEVPHAQ